MLEEPNKPNVPGNSLANATRESALVVANARSRVVQPPGSVHDAGKPGRLKKIAWRGTAIAYWIWRITRLLLGSEFMNNLTSTMTIRFSAFFSSLGFTPVHSE